jgi:hypothetical protein
MTIGKRALLVIFLIAAVGLAACVVRTAPVHRQHGAHPAQKHKPQKHKKHKKHGKHKH